MGDRSQTKVRCVVLAVVFAVLLLAEGPAGAGEGKKMSQAEAAVVQFRTGVLYQPPPTAFLREGRLLVEELEPFGPALRDETGRVREQIVRLLADAGRRSDPLFPIGGQILRQPRIVAMLVEDGLAHEDLGREAALAALVRYSPAEILRPHAKVLTKDLEERPGTTVFLLAAKAKPPGALPVVQKLLASPRWAKELNARVAAAALGSAEIEKEFLDSFRRATDPKEKARLAQVLGWIGTDAALRALADAIRTDLVVEMTHVSRRSVRLDVLSALAFNFPDQQALFESQLLDDSGYERAEAFCRKRFGTTWDRPRPPFLTIAGAPIPRPR